MDETVCFVSGSDWQWHNCVDPGRSSPCAVGYIIVLCGLVPSWRHWRHFLHCVFVWMHGHDSILWLHSGFTKYFRSIALRMTCICLLSLWKASRGRQFCGVEDEGPNPPTLRSLTSRHIVCDALSSRGVFIQGENDVFRQRQRHSSSVHPAHSTHLQQTYHITGSNVLPYLNTNKNVGRSSHPNTSPTLSFRQHFPHSAGATSRARSRYKAVTTRNPDSASNHSERPSIPVHNTKRESAL